MRSLIRWSLIVTLLGLSLSFGWMFSATTVQSQAPAPHIIYDDALVNSWEDWSWDPITLNVNNASPRHGGSHSLAVTYTGGWGAVQLGHQPELDLSGYDTLRFWIHGGSSGGQNVSVRVNEEEEQVITLQANQWRQIDFYLWQCRQWQDFDWVGAGKIIVGCDLDSVRH